MPHRLPGTSENNFCICISRRAGSLFPAISSDCSAPPGKTVPLVCYEVRALQDKQKRTSAGKSNFQTTLKPLQPSWGGGLVYLFNPSHEHRIRTDSLIPHSPKELPRALSRCLLLTVICNCQRQRPLLVQSVPEF